jgi:hypothetical protein
MDEYCSMNVKACQLISSLFASLNFFIWDFGPMP